MALNSKHSAPQYLPTPSSNALVQSAALAQIIQTEINSNNGWISFAQFMQLALYEPNLGYYTGGSQKLGDAVKGGGDFVTAPQITPLFAQSLAKQVVQIVEITSGSVLELGAGTGLLAVDLLLVLSLKNQLPAHYYILEVSNHLRQVQHETIYKLLPNELAAKVIWLETLPQAFTGLILGNEVLDAISVHVLANTEYGLQERGVSVCAEEFIWKNQPIADDSLLKMAKQYELPNPYITEFCPAANGLIANLAGLLKHGIILMIDYGFSAKEYYHPQRNHGTLMCHYQHYANSDPLIYAGLQDITAHVNFTEIAEAGYSHGLDVAGYTSQAQFLINCGITELLNQVSPNDFAAYLPAVSAVQKLVSPAEMGDLFKVIALTKGIHVSLTGFDQGDKRHTL
ncbi:MAG: SAM-dependent methyltransferase [Methylophilaceae bacterium]|nr:SAM-dependent methyltransferase [Methylophilaceae bacterium]